MAGLPMTAGFQGWKSYYPPEDAPLVKSIRQAGGIILAKGSLSEFARGTGDNINSVIPGYSRNPYNTAYGTGGSSGGNGAAVAASFAVVGIGTDTLGSVRMPSAFNALSRSCGRPSVSYRAQASSPQFRSRHSRRPWPAASPTWQSSWMPWSEATHEMPLPGRA